METFSIVLYMLAGLLPKIAMELSTAYLPETVAVIFLVARKYIVGSKFGFASCLGFTVVMLMVVRADFLYSWFDMKIKCSYASDVVVYREVSLSSEYFDEEGWPIYFEKDRVGLFREEAFDGRYTIKKNHISPKIGAKQLRYSLVDTDNASVLSKVDVFSAQSGWYSKLIKKWRTYKYCGTSHGMLVIAYLGGNYENPQNIVNRVFIRNELSN